MKKLFVILFAAASLLAVSCGGDGTIPDEPDTTKETPGSGDNNGNTGNETPGNEIPGDKTYADGEIVSLKVETLAENPNGLAIGLWTHDGTYAAQTFADFGRRPWERVGFYTWSKFEAKKGVYDDATIVKKIQAVYRYGGVPLIALNNISGPWFNTTFTSQIPSFYLSNPTANTDPLTPEVMAGGEKYIKYMINAFLTQCGRVVVAFDYEMMWNCTPDTPVRREIIRKWFVAAVGWARQAAAAIDMSDKLTVMPLVNGSVSEDFSQKMFGSPLVGHKPADWMMDIMDVSDALAFDNYHIDRSNVTSEEDNIMTMEFWIKNYGKRRDGTLLPVYMAETGFSSGMTEDPTYKDTSDKAIGTESEQATYYGNLLPAVVRENVRGRRLNGQLRLLNLWMYHDHDMDKNAATRQNYYGLVRLKDNSYKPAFYVVKNNVKSVEENAATNPSLVKSSVTADPASDTPIATVFKDGLNLDRIVAEFKVTPNAKYTLTMDFGKTGSVVVHIGESWFQAADVLGTSFTFTSPASELVTVEIYPTGTKLPFSQSVKKLSIKKV